MSYAAEWKCEPEYLGVGRRVDLAHQPLKCTGLEPIRYSWLRNRRGVKYVAAVRRPPFSEQDFHPHYLRNTQDAPGSTAKVARQHRHDMCTQDKTKLFHTSEVKQAAF